MSEIVEIIKIPLNAISIHGEIAKLEDSLLLGPTHSGNGVENISIKLEDVSDLIPIRVKRSNNRYQCIGGFAVFRLLKHHCAETAIVKAHLYSTRIGTDALLQRYFKELFLYPILVAPRDSDKLQIYRIANSKEWRDRYESIVGRLTDVQFCKNFDITRFKLSKLKNANSTESE